ncbi:hypothetical protein FNQ90_20450, partial [Streptomyces alkaliphilus]|nr:hypothetical protein [Streptomyces alkaliphilus]
MAHVIRMMLQANQVAEAEAEASDPGRIEERLARESAVDIAADLARVPTPAAAARAEAFARTVHLLAPTDPRHSLRDVLRSRLADVPEWRESLTEHDRRSVGSGARLANAWPLPDLPEPVETNTLWGRRHAVVCIRFLPGGRRIATLGVDGYVKVWDRRAGRCETTFVPGAAHGRIVALAPFPDGVRLAAGTDRGALLILRATDGGSADDPVVVLPG